MRFIEASANSPFHNRHWISLSSGMCTNGLCASILTSKSIEVRKYLIECNITEYYPCFKIFFEKVVRFLLLEGDFRLTRSTSYFTFDNWSDNWVTYKFSDSLLHL
jgi:hypothetical protein